MKTTEPAHALLMLVPEAGDAFWKNSPLAPEAALRQVRRLLPGLQGRRVVVATTPRFATQLQPLAHQLLTVHPEPETEPWLPAATSQALQALPQDSAVLVADLRCLDATDADAQTLCRAWEREPQNILTLAEAPRENPCQFLRHYNASSVGYAVLFDTRQEAHGVPVVRSRPFSLPAPTLDPCANLAGIWNLASLLAGAPQEENPAAALAAGRAICHFQVDGRAVALLPEDALPRLRVAAREEQPLLAGVALDAQGTFQAVVQCENGKYYFRLLQGGHAPESSLLLHLAYPGQSFDLTYHPQGRCELPGLPDAPGIPFALLQEVHSGGYDITRSVQQDQGLWRREGGVLIRNDTNQIIHGRQAYPDCVRLSPSLCMGRAGDLLRPDASTLRALSVGRPLGLVRNEIDHLRHTIFQKRTRQDVPARPFPSDRKEPQHAHA
ncbi:MAG: hypothetical protein AB7E32_02345 [Desulfovibrio sp.]